MPLTAAQYATLNAFILATPALASKPNNSDGAFDIAVEINKTRVPDFYVWRTSTPTAEIMQNGFDWTRVDNLTVGKARIFDWMTRLPTINLSQANVRAGVEATFSVEIADAGNRLSVYTHGQRPCTVFEFLYATGAGTTTTNHGVGPATMAVEGPVSPADVFTARNPNP